MRNQLDLQSHTVLLAGVELPGGPTASIQRFLAADARGVLLALRATPIDLLLTGESLGGEPFTSLVQRVRLVRPGQKWALVAPEIDEAREIDARALGVLAIFQGPPSAAQLCEILARLRPPAPPGPVPVVTRGVRVPHPRPPRRERAPTPDVDPKPSR
jgi:hypothetical protein